MSSFKNAEAGVIVDKLIKTIQEQRDYLSEIDGKIGDGDHGINMNKGFTMCEEKLKGQTYNMSEGLCTLGETLLEDIGGSMGPLYGLLFDEFSAASENKEGCRQGFCRMSGCHERGCKKRMGIHQRPGCKDRTCKPSWRAFQRCSGCGSYKLLFYYHGDWEWSKRTAELNQNSGIM